MLFILLAACTSTQPLPTAMMVDTGDPPVEEPAPEPTPPSEPAPAPDPEPTPTPDP
jgi:hypothetical protein